MNIQASILLLASCCMMSVGCQRQSEMPDGSFHLTVQPIVASDDDVISLLKIAVRRDASISIDGHDFHSMVVLPNSPSGAVRGGQIALAASRIAPQGDKFAYIETLIRPEASNHASVPNRAVYPVPASTKLDAFFSISATDGNHKLDTPVEIARLDGKPVMLVVGKPTVPPNTTLEPTDTAPSVSTGK